METQLHICYICAGGLNPADVCSLVRSSVSESPPTQGSGLVDFAALPVEFLSPSEPSIPFFNFSIRVLAFHPMFGYIYFSQLLGGISQ